MALEVVIPRSPELVEGRSGINKSSASSITREGLICYNLNYEKN
jgi:hypothetical protein